MTKIENEDEAAARLEAALYSSGRPLSIEELIKAPGTENRAKFQSSVCSNKPGTEFRP